MLFILSILKISKYIDMIEREELKGIKLKNNIVNYG